MDNRNKKPAAGTAGGGQSARGTNARRLYFSISGKPVASLCGRTLQKRVRGSIHMLRKPPAWCIDAAILEAARRDGALIVEIYDSESNVTYWAAVNAFDRFGFRFNRGFGEQIGLALAHWQIEAQDARQLSFEL